MTTVIADGYLHFVSLAQATIPGYPLSARRTLTEVRKVISEAPVLWVNCTDNCIQAAQMMLGVCAHPIFRR